MNKEKGIVKWFNNQKGYGFISKDDGADIFVHFTAINQTGYKSLKKGEEVDYELRVTPKGPQAVNVIRKPENMTDDINQNRMIFPDKPQSLFARKVV